MRIAPYPLFAAGKRVLGHEISIERPHLEINLAPHPAFRGRIAVGTFRGSSLIVEPDSGTSLYVKVRNNRWRCAGVHTVDARGRKTVTSDRVFEIRVARGKTLLLDLAPPSPWTAHVYIESLSGPIAVDFGACNVMHVSVAE